MHLPSALLPPPFNFFIRKRSRKDYHSQFKCAASVFLLEFVMIIIHNDFNCLFMYLSFRVRSENWKTGLERKLTRGSWFKIRQPRLLVNIIRATTVRVNIFWKYPTMNLFWLFPFFSFCLSFFSFAV